MSVNDFFVGQATDKKLRNLGIRTIGELAHTDRELIRHLSVQASQIRSVESHRPMELFVPDYEKYEKQDVAIDKIRSRYGVDAVQRAVFINSPIYHIGGGIPKHSIQQGKSH